MFSDKRELGARTLLYPSPFVLCGTYDADGKPNISAIAYVGVCCATPPALQISLRKSRYSHSSILEKRAFTVNIPSERYADQADYCGIASGRDADKFTVAKLTPKRGKFVDAPIVAEFPICMECKLIHYLEIGSHDMFIGEVLNTWVSESCIEPDGSVNPFKVGSLAYMGGDGAYYTMGYSVGRAFNIGKSLMED